MVPVRVRGNEGHKSGQPYPPGASDGCIQCGPQAAGSVHSPLRLVCAPPRLLLIAAHLLWVSVVVTMAQPVRRPSSVCICFFQSFTQGSHLALPNGLIMFHFLMGKHPNGPDRQPAMD